MRVSLHWAEHFLNFYPFKTKLYLRGERGKDHAEARALQNELFKALVPFFDGLRKDAIREGHQQGLRINARVFDWAERTVSLNSGGEMPAANADTNRRFGVTVDICDAAGNSIGTFQTPLHKKYHRVDADSMVENITAHRSRVEKESAT